MSRQMQSDNKHFLQKKQENMQNCILLGDALEKQLQMPHDQLNLFC